MFEQFTRQARDAVAAAVAEAKANGIGSVGCEHLLIGLASGREGPAAGALASAGLDVRTLRELAPRRDSAQSLDADALAVLGIDLDEVRRSAEAAFGPGALDAPAPSRSGAHLRVRLAPDGKRAVELALRGALREHKRSISSGHILIGIIDQGDNSALRILAGAQVDPADLRADIVDRLAAAA
jgi:ATP-dependent Clp protease ATP-binding subunit ClpA